MEPPRLQSRDLAETRWRRGQLSPLGGAAIGVGAVAPASQTASWSRARPADAAGSEAAPRSHFGDRPTTREKYMCGHLSPNGVREESCGDGDGGGDGDGDGDGGGDGDVGSETVAMAMSLAEARRWR